MAQRIAETVKDIKGDFGEMPRLANAACLAALKKGAILSMQNTK